MAIDKTYFNNDTYTLNYNAVLAWLQANAVDYFDTIEGDDERHRITMTKGAASLYFDVGSAAYLGVTTGAGTSSADSSPVGIGYSDNKVSFDYGVKTSTGLALIGESAYDDGLVSLFVSLTDRGTPCMYARWSKYQRISDSYNTGDINVFCDLERDQSIGKVPITDGCFYHWTDNRSIGITALTPFCFQSGSYALNMFITPFSQYAADKPGTINFNGMDYFYDGYVALKE